MNDLRELFVLPDSLINVVHGSNPSQAVCEIIADMVEFDIFRLPYGVVDVRFVATKTGQAKLLIKNLRLRNMPKNIDGLFVEGTKTFNFAIGEVHYNNSFDWSGLRSPTDTDAEREANAAALCDVAAITLILSLATSNVDKKVINNKRARLGIGKSENKAYSHITYLKLPTTCGDHKSNDESERSSPKMHLRRGHSRRQRFGKNNAEIKRIWVAPTFVNADDTYVPRREYRVAVEGVA
jgi:hypothetical protein